jgi:nicotinamide-nucleotide amidase
VTAAILSIGTELTRGEVLNTNATWLAEQLTVRGFDVTEKRVVDDDPARISEALEALRDRHQLIVVSGGLGPTTDDITTACVAQVAEQTLVTHQLSLERITARLTQMGRTLSPSNAKQAMIPAEATALRNDCGMAPGYHLRLGDAELFVLPGVPSEMCPMFENYGVPRLPEPEGQRVVQICLHSLGVPESTLNDSLAEIALSYQVELGYLVRSPEVDVKILVRGTNLNEMQQHCRQAADAVRDRLGEAVYAEGATSLPEVVGEMLGQRHLVLGLAESCTGGLVAHLLTQVAGASQWFCGGIVSYANSVKEGVLGVSSDSLMAHGAVSEEVAREMATGARNRLGCDVALAITGICGPAGGTPTKPVGTVHFAVATSNQVHHARHLLVGERTAIQRRAAFTALALLRTALGRYA